MPGVSAVKVHPVWNSDVSPAALIPGEAVRAWYEEAAGALAPSVSGWLRAVYEAAADKKLTVGGTVRLVLLAAGNTAPTAALLERVQTAIDPTQNAGEGLGLAPIGHVVHVAGVTEEPVDITLHLTYAHGWNWEAAQSHIEQAIDGYFSTLAGTWADTDHLTVRISQIESRLLAACAAILTDIGGTQINGAEQNLILGPDCIPVRGNVCG